MPQPICKAQSDVDKSQISRVQAEANQKFTQAQAVRDEEILDNGKWRERLQSLKPILGEDLNLNQLVGRIMRHMDTAGMPQWRTYQNIRRLVKSTRITDEALKDWLQLSLDPKDIGLFRDRAQQILLGAQLFFYEYIPQQGTAWCYMPKNH